MFRFALWKFYVKLMNNKRPSYFENMMKPVLPGICDNYGIRRPSPYENIWVKSKLFRRKVYLAKVDLIRTS